MYECPCCATPLLESARACPCCGINLPKDWLSARLLLVFGEVPRRIVRDCEPGQYPSSPSPWGENNMRLLEEQADDDEGL